MGSSVPAQVQTDYLRTVVRPFVCTVQLSDLLSECEGRNGQCMLSLTTSGGTQLPPTL